MRPAIRPVPRWCKHSISTGADLGDRLLPAASAHSHPVDDISLLGLVTQPPGLVRPGWTCQAHNAWQLTIFPAANAEEKPATEARVRIGVGVRSNRPKKPNIAPYLITSLCFRLESSSTYL